MSKARNPAWTLNAKDSETLPSLTMIQTPNGIWHLSAEASLPKTLFGHNARLPNQSEVLEGLEMISEYVEANSGLHFDAKTATVSRVDFAKDFLLSEAKISQLIKSYPIRLCEERKNCFTTIRHFTSKLNLDKSAFTVSFGKLYREDMQSRKI